MSAYARWDAARGLYHIETECRDSGDWQQVRKHEAVIEAFCREHAQYEVVMGIPASFDRVRKLAALDENKDIVALMTLEDRSCH